MEAAEAARLAAACTADPEQQCSVLEPLLRQQLIYLDLPHFDLCKTLRLLETAYRRSGREDRAQAAAALEEAMTAAIESHAGAAALRSLAEQLQSESLKTAFPFLRPALLAAAAAELMPPA